MKITIIALTAIALTGIANAQTIEWGDPSSGNLMSSGVYDFSTIANASYSHTFTPSFTQAIYSPTTSAATFNYPDGIWSQLIVGNTAATYNISLLSSETYYFYVTEWENLGSPLIQDFTTNGTVTMAFNDLGPNGVWDAVGTKITYSSSKSAGEAILEITAVKRVCPLIRKCLPFCLYPSPLNL